MEREVSDQRDVARGEYSWRKSSYQDPTRAGGSGLVLHEQYKRNDREAERWLQLVHDSKMRQSKSLIR
jgi:hypothetical protein